MPDRITSFKLDWFDCGLCCVDDVVHECITISRNKKQLVFKQLNGYGGVVSTEEIRIAVFISSLHSALNRKPRKINSSRKPTHSILNTYRQISGREKLKCTPHHKFTVGISSKGI